MRCNTFARSALFAAGAAAGWLPWALVAAPLAGVWNALTLYLVATTALYIGALLPGSAGGQPAFPRRPRRINIIVVAGLAAASLAGFARTPTELAVALAATLGVARSAFLYRTAPARAAATEVTLLVGGLMFARFLAGPSLASVGLALWGFLLVQSLFFLAAGMRPWPPSGRRSDPFEEAHRRAVALLEQAG
jgi:hypothetical protein